MAKTHFEVVAEGDRWMIVLGAKSYGPMLTRQRAIDIAKSLASRAAQTNPHGADVVLRGSRPAGRVSRVLKMDA